MPNIKSAKKKVRKDVKREAGNIVYEKQIKTTIKGLGKTKSGKKAEAEVNKAYSLIDKASKRKVIHKNKAARLKSMVTRIAK
ncbi:30S ribosomal protein S20 [Candidatus Roizmanbacteria bacterium]|nr:30S ribosomal protein S20 [Candidatus Roizmanbacteria bacterium]